MLNSQGAPEPKLTQLYQEVILDHNARPRNYKTIENPSQYSHGVNPLCGDDYHLYLKTNVDGVVEDVGFQGSGCAISKSSASLMTTFAKGKKISELVALRKQFLKLLTDQTLSEDEKKNLGRLIIFQGVREFPVRVKCATLAWHALGDALKDAGAQIEEE